MRYHYCPICSQPLAYQQHEGEELPVCQNSSCGFIFWQNSKPCVSVFIADSAGRLLLTVRAREPDKGKLDLPGGFLQAGEHPHHGAQREIKEELDVDIEVQDHLGYFIDQYGKDGDYTLTIGVTAKIVSGTPRPADDVAAIEWIDPKTITPDRLAFTNNQNFLALWLARHG